MTSNCGNLGTLNAPIVDCSYSSSNTETPFFPNTVSGDYYLMLVTNFSNQYGDITSAQIDGEGTFDCAVSSNSGYKYYNGITYYDINQNGIKDSDDIKMPSVQFNETEANYIGYSDNNGQFNYIHQSIDSVNYIVTSNKTGWHSTISPIQYQFTLDSINYFQDSIFFGYYPNNFIKNATIDITSAYNNCETGGMYWGNLLNTGTDSVNINFQIKLPSQLYLDSSYLSYDSLINNIIYYSMDSLSIFENIEFPIMVKPNNSTSVNLNDTLSLTSLINIKSITNELILTNFDTMYTIANCSNISNTKTSLLNGLIEHDTIQTSDRIEYIINFQRIGFNTAYEINIIDELHPYLDISTFQFISSSHEPIYSIDNNRNLKFKFENIMLVGSNVDSILSRGYVKFSIKPLSNLEPTQIIYNSASIKFNYSFTYSTEHTNTTQNIIDCFIVPENANFSIVNNEIHSNLNDPNYTYIWVYDNDTLSNETNNFIQNQGNGLYTLIVYNQYQCKTNSTYSLSLSINKLDNNSILIYPLPSSSEFTIKSSNQLISSILITDINGKICEKITNINALSTVIMDDSIESGTYFVEITTLENQIVTKKIIKL